MDVGGPDVQGEATEVHRRAVLVAGAVADAQHLLVAGLGQALGRSAAGVDERVVRHHDVAIPGLDEILALAVGDVGVGVGPAEVEVGRVDAAVIVVEVIEIVEDVVAEVRRRHHSAAIGRAEAVGIEAGDIAAASGQNEEEERGRAISSWRGG